MYIIENPSFVSRSINSPAFAASMGAARLGLYCAKNYYNHAEFLSLGEDGIIIDLGVSLAPGRYHSKAALALKDTLFEVLS
ncbi:MAG: hypothetical protein IJ859_02825 [Synergistaceae bacterium]|nr:hypothetical protein [Synergistaceae bacterium]